MTLSSRGLVASRRDQDIGSGRDGTPTTSARPAARPPAALSSVARRLSTPALDSVVWAAGLVMFSMFRLDSTRAVINDDTARIVGLAVVAQLTIGTITQLYRVRWRIASFEELLALGYTIAMATTVTLVVDVISPMHAVPASAVIAAGALTLVFCGAARATWRMWSERSLRPRGAAVPAVIFGVGEAGVQLVHSLMLTPDSPYRPVALLDDHPAKKRLRIRHLQVEGTSADLPRVAAQRGAEALIVAIPSAGSEVIRRMSDLANQTGLTMRVLPPVRELLSERVGPENLRPVTPDDLLGRRVIRTDLEAIAGYLTGRRVLVTGAGGSIGSELCRQLVRFGPERLVMLDRDESALHAVQLSIEGRALLDTRNLVVCDIRDRDGLDAVFAEHHPEVVFHAAALKHLPLLEMWPSEAVKTNVAGTRNVLEAALAAGVERFVNVSTDKAANPISVLGYTKRVAERLTAGAAERTDGTYLSVRFGNVLGSRGSVLTTFREQIANGGPVTVTDPAVTRFFMTIAEAVELVIQAGAVGRSGEVLILDMGRPVRITEVAERLITESGRDMEIVYTGLRPGEKIDEELFGEGECDVRPCHPLISHASVPALDLRHGDLAGDGPEVRGRLSELCRTRALSAAKL